MRRYITNLCMHAVALALSATGLQPLLAQDQTTKESKPNQTSSNQNLLKQKIDAACDEYHLPSIWAGQFVMDREPNLAVSGVRKWGEKESAAINDPVHLGSCTKAMTAVLIGQLCSEGKLTLDTTLGEIFSDQKYVIDSAWSEVTVNQLMQHRSGAVANLDFFGIDARYPDDVVAARQEVLQRMCESERPHTPTFLYSNVGFIVLGHIVEKLDIRPWEQSMQQRLFERLNIKHANFGPVGKPDSLTADSSVLPDRPWGHIQSAGFLGAIKSIFGHSSPPEYTPQQIDNSRCLGPAGRVHMPLAEWSKFVIEFAKPDGYQSLGVSAEVFTQMLTPVPDAKPEEQYGAGWIIFEKPLFGGRAYFHNGSNTTWYCYAVAAPGKKQSVLVATNVYTEAAKKACDEIAKSLIATQIE